MQRNRRRTRRKEMKTYSRFVVYPKKTRVEVVESACWQDGFTGVVVDNDIIHGRVCHECSNREVCHSVAGLRLPTPSPRQVLVRSDAIIKWGSGCVGDDLTRAARLMADGLYTEWVPKHMTQRIDP